MSKYATHKKHTATTLDLCVIHKGAPASECMSFLFRVPSNEYIEKNTHTHTRETQINSQTFNIAMFRGAGKPRRPKRTDRETLPLGHPTPARRNRVRPRCHCQLLYCVPLQLQLALFARVHAIMFTSERVRVHVFAVRRLILDQICFGYHADTF